MNINNERIKLELFKRKIPQWKLAKALGISENTLCRRLRYELTKDQTDEIIKIIDSMRGDE